MAEGLSYGKALARRAPPPDEMEALGEEPANPGVEPRDEDGDTAAAMSAYEDFARLAGFKASPQTFAAFKELVNLVVE